MSSLRDRLIIKVARLKDFLAHVDRADRVYYVERGTYLVALASNFLWEGDLSSEDKKVIERWNKVKEYKGVQVEEFLDAYEASDYLKAISSKS
jgi:ribosomal protein S13